MFFCFAGKEINGVHDAICRFTKTSRGGNQDKFAVQAMIEMPDQAWAMKEFFVGEGHKDFGCEKLFQS